MAKFEWKPETTPKGEKVLTADFSAELVSIAKEPLMNVNKVGYYPATIKFLNEKDETVTRTGLVYEANFNHGMNVGSTYLSKVVKQQGKLPLIIVSHLDRAGTSSDADFGLSDDVFASVDFDAIAK